MAQIANPRKAFNFTILVLGMNPFLAQEVDIPEFEVEAVEHGDTNHDIKTAGRVKFGNIRIKKISTADGPDTTFWAWLESCQNAILGGGTVPQLYKRNVVITQFATDGQTPIAVWQCQGVWPSKISGVNFKRMASENTMEDIELCVDVVKAT